MVESTVQNTAAEGVRGKHAGNKWLEFHIAMVEIGGDGSLKLNLDGLEAVERQSVL